MSNYDLSLHAFRVLHNSYKAIINALKKDIAKHHLNETEFMVLELLLSKGSNSIQNIAKKIDLTSGSMTYVVNQLEKKEMIEKLQCENDKRIWYLTLTQKGKEYIEPIFKKHSIYVNQLFLTLSDDEKVILIDLLKKVGLPLKNGGI